MGKRRVQREINSKRSRADKWVYVVTIVFSAVFLFAGNRIATRNLSVFMSDGDSEQFVKAKVMEITQRDVNQYSFDGDNTLENIILTLEAQVLSGDNKGETVVARQDIDELYFSATPEVKEGDKILLLENQAEEGGAAQWLVVELVRSDKILVFGALFILALLVFGRSKGINTILSLGFTCMAIFVIFIPSILSGRNIYVSSVVICVFIIIMTFLIISGANRKTAAAMLGCFGGVLIAGILTIVMRNILSLTGYVDEDSIYLTYISSEIQIDLRAIIFAAVIIGAIGAIMDVAMSIASSLWEISEKSDALSRGEMFRSGMNIGRDVMGTMANTLILAYIGSSLSVVLLLSVYSGSLLYLMNRELIIVEMLQALVGSFGILAAVPLTSLISALLYKESERKKQSRMLEGL